jgi:hypothetical protein
MSIPIDFMDYVEEVRPWGDDNSGLTLICLYAEEGVSKFFLTICGEVLFTLNTLFSAIGRYNVNPEVDSFLTFVNSFVKKARFNRMYHYRMRDKELSVNVLPIKISERDDSVLVDILPGGMWSNIIQCLELKSDLAPLMPCLWAAGRCEITVAHAGYCSILRSALFAPIPNLGSQMFCYSKGLPPLTISDWSVFADHSVDAIFFSSIEPTLLGIKKYFSQFKTPYRREFVCNYIIYGNQNSLYRAAHQVFDDLHNEAVPKWMANIMSGFEPDDTIVFCNDLPFYVRATPDGPLLWTLDPTSLLLGSILMHPKINTHDGDCFVTNYMVSMYAHVYTHLGVRYGDHRSERISHPDRMYLILDTILKKDDVFYSPFNDDSFKRWDSLLDAHGIHGAAFTLSLMLKHFKYTDVGRATMEKALIFLNDLFYSMVKVRSVLFFERGVISSLAPDPVNKAKIQFQLLKSRKVIRHRDLMIMGKCGVTKGSQTRSPVWPGHNDAKYIRGLFLGYEG